MPTKVGIHAFRRATHRKAWMVRLRAP